MRHPRSGSGAPVSLILAFVFPAIVGAALALAYYGYQYVDDVSRLFEASIREDARGDASDLFRAIEARIDDAAVTLFRQLDLAQEDGPLEAACKADLGPMIESYIVLNAKKASVCVLDKRQRAEWDTYKRTLNWESLRPSEFRHEHRTLDAGSVLIAYSTRQMRDGTKYYVAAKLKLDVIQTDWLDEEIAKLSKTRRVAVIDEHGNTISGSPLGPHGRDDRFLYEDLFGKTLYKWRVRIAPKDVDTLQAKAERKKVFGPLLIILSTVIIAVGLGIVWMAVLSERRASRLKSDFIANVSHELKTPLSLIRMFGELVATGKHKGEGVAREYGGIITRESERLSHLIDNVLDFARLERGKASYDFSQGDMADVLERALDVCRYRVEKDKMKLRTEVDPGLPPVRMDHNAMTLVILNLVDNAIKYAADGGIVDVSLGRTPGGVVIAVRDHGPGIAVDEQLRVFERFYRARSARDRNVRGSGIGLSLVKHIAEAHGGRVTVESPAPGGTATNPGSVFRVFLPAPVHDGAESAARHDAPHLGPTQS